MAEGNSRIDALLKAYAKKCRDQASAVEIHPATRQMLQGEVKRTFHAAQPAQTAAKPRMLPILWPRLAFGAAMAAVFMALVFVYQTRISRKPGTEMAQLSPPTEKAANDSERRALNGARSEEIVSRDGAKLADKKAPGSSAAPVALEEAERETSINKPQAEIGAAPAKNAEGQWRFAGKGGSLDAAPRVQTMGGQIAAAHADTSAFATAESAEPQVAATTPPAPASPAAAPAAEAKAAAVRSPAPAMPLASAAPAVSTASASGAIVQRLDLGRAETNGMRFVQENSGRYRENLLSPPPPEVLRAFEFFKTGNTVKIIDADGSVYEGQLLVSAGQELPRKAPVRAAKAAEALASEPKREISAPQSFSFRVLGMNRELQELVTINGTFQAPVARAPAGHPVGQSTPEALAKAKQAAESESAPAAAAIQGRVKIGTATEFPLDARQTEP